MRTIPHAKLLLPIVLATLLGSEVILSLSGRNTYALRFVPFLSLQMMVIFIGIICGMYMYALWGVIRKKNIRLTLASISLLVLLGCTGLTSFIRLREISEDEARNVAMAVMAGSKEYPVKYQSEGVKSAFYELQTRKAEISQGYAFHPYGRYTFLFSVTGPRLIMSVDKGHDGWRVFIAEKTE